MNYIFDFLVNVVDEHVSDVHIREDEKIYIRKDGAIYAELTESRYNKVIRKKDILEFVEELIERGCCINIDNIEQGTEQDFSFDMVKFRFRGNIFLFTGRIGVSLRRINKKIKSIEELGLPKIIRNIANINDGLVIFTGPTGSGKSSTWASIIEDINKSKRKHIITIEDPIEYVFKNDLSIITQREVSIDSKSFLTALKYVLRQDPDIVVIGEIRDSESLKCAIRVAQTGHLCISTMHTMSVSETIDRMLGMFDDGKRDEMSMYIASVLKVVVSQQLIHSECGIIPVIGYMSVDNSIRHLIREEKTDQIDIYINNSAENMISMDKEILRLYMDEQINYHTAIARAVDIEGMKKAIGVRGFL